MYFRRTRHSELQFGFFTGSPIKGLFTFPRPLFYLLQNRLYLFAFFRRATASAKQARSARHETRPTWEAPTPVERSLRACLCSPENANRVCLALSSLKRSRMHRAIFFIAFSNSSFLSKKKTTTTDHQRKKKAHICLIHISSVTQTNDFPNSQHTGKQISHLA